LESQAQQNQLLERQNEIQYIKLNSQRQQNSYAWALFGLAFILCVLLAFMVLHNRKNKRKLLQLANLDSLTGLLNRRKTLEMLQPQFELSVRHKFDFCIVLVDLDFFKKINDQYGHAMGDKVLELFGRMCRQTFRYTDIVGRVGGEEFVIALPHTKQHDAEYILVSLRDKFRNLAVELQIEGLHTSLSGGLSVYTDQAKVTDMLAQADDALYRAKQQGRDRVEIYMPTSEVTPLMA
jgi:diguanylate cyclase (GGDEF)-like protein